MGMLTKILSYVFYFFARLFHWSYRFRYFGLEHLDAARARHPQGAYCLASWHEHALAGVLGQKGMPYCFLISKSADGEFVDFICRRLGYETVRGSSSKGGKEARDQLQEVMSRGVSPAFTVDGPRGPRHKPKPGIIKTAVHAGAAILPVAAVAENPWVMVKAWDKTKIPRPFSNIAYQFGPVLELPEELDGEAFDEALLVLEARIKETEALAEENLRQLEGGAKSLPPPKRLLKAG